MNRGDGIWLSQGAIGITWQAIDYGGSHHLHNHTDFRVGSKNYRSILHDAGDHKVSAYSGFPA